MADDRRGAISLLPVGDTIVGWQVDLDTAVEVVVSTSAGFRIPEPLRRARQTCLPFARRIRR
jgi:hypothetical protein